MKKPVVCVHGPQGSGKTYLIKAISNDILTNYSSIPEYINIKSTFTPIANSVQKHFSHMGYELTEAQQKKLLLAISTFGEMEVDTKIWTNRWIAEASLFPNDVVLVDDIRTEFNLEGLLSLDRPVILFRLNVPENIRRERLGDKWRSNGGYTEMLLEKPDSLPNTFTWVDLDENWTMDIIRQSLEKYL